MMFLRLLVQRWWHLLLPAVCAGVLAGAANTAILAVINSGIVREHDSYATVAWLFAGLCILSPAARILSQLILITLGENTLFDLRMELSRKVLAVPLRTLEQIGSARILAVLTDDIPTITGMIALVPAICINIAIFLTCIGYMLWLSPRLLLALSGLFIVGVITYQLSINRAFQQFRLAREAVDQVQAHLQALTAGVKELKLHRARRAAFFDSLLGSAALELKNFRQSGMKRFAFAASWGQVLVFLAIGLTVFVMPHILSLNSKVMTGFALCLLFLTGTLESIVNLVPGIGRADVALRKINDLGFSLSVQEKETPYVAEKLPEQWDRIDFRSVVYKYDGRDRDTQFTLGPLDLTFCRGELIFLTGGNGSGKTTFAKLLVGLYQPDEGRIEIGGVDISDAVRDIYRQFFSVVFSDFCLFDRLLGTCGPSVDEHARQYLTRLNLQTNVQIANGRLSTTDLSQGQRKRLALLAAYMEDRPIYCFDEWTADQDPSFREVFYYQLLPELKARGKTIFIISHDDRYYDVGDRIIKLDAGKVVSDSLTRFARTQDVDVQDALGDLGRTWS